LIWRSGRDSNPLADARGVPELQALLARAEQEWEQAHTALHTAARATHRLSAFHGALVHLRAVLEPFRDRLSEYEEDADALFWAGVTTDAAVQPVLAVLRTPPRSQRSAIRAPEPAAEACPATAPVARAPLTDLHRKAIFMQMRTTLILDETLLDKARQLSGLTGKTAVLHAGLEALIARESARRLAALGGSDRTADVARTLKLAPS